MEEGIRVPLGEKAVEIVAERSVDPDVEPHEGIAWAAPPAPASCRDPAGPAGQIIKLPGGCSRVGKWVALAASPATAAEGAEYRWS